MEEQFRTFVNEKFGTLRAIIMSDEPWFVGKDAATSLEYKDTDQAIRVNVDDRDKKLINAKMLQKMAAESKPVQEVASESNPVQYTGLEVASESNPVRYTGLEVASESNPVRYTGLEFNSPRGLIFINLSGLFSLILSSKMEKAKEYRHWVTSEVLPKIHGYKKDNAIETPAAVAPAASDTINIEKIYCMLKCAKLTNLDRLRNQILREVMLELTGKKF